MRRLSIHSHSEASFAKLRVFQGSRRFGCALLLSLSFFLPPPALLAWEYPLFKPNDPQQVVFRYGLISDRANRKNANAKLHAIENSNEKYPFIRMDFEIKTGATTPTPRAGIFFSLEETRIQESEARLLLRLRASEKNLPVTLKIKDVDGNESSVELAKFGGTDTSWKYYTIPFDAFYENGKKLKPFIDTLTILSSHPGKGAIDVAFIGINVP